MTFEEDRALEAFGETAALGSRPGRRRAQIMAWILTFVMVGGLILGTISLILG